MKVCSSFSLSASCSRSAATRRIGPPAEVCEGLVGYFDSASNAGAYGVGIVIVLDSLISFRLLMDFGYGTNTKSELLALWGLLFFAKYKNFMSLQIRVNSKVIIDWAMNKHAIQSVVLKHC